MTVTVFRNPGDGAGSGSGGSGAHPITWPARLPVQLTRVPAGPQRPHVVSSNTDISVLVTFYFFRGTFRMEREDGHAFDCRIPPFSLESKHENPNDPQILGNWWIMNIVLHTNYQKSIFNIHSLYLTLFIITNRIIYEYIHFSLNSFIEDWQLTVSLM